MSVQLVVIQGLTYAAYNGRTPIMAVKSDIPLTRQELEAFRIAPVKFLHAHASTDKETA